MYDDDNYEIRESERRMLLSLCNDNYCVESSIGIKKENSIKITEGPLKGQESLVRKINRHKRQSLIGINFMG